MSAKDTIREERITYEIIVDCYNEVEVAMGWYYYLQANLVFPFDARLLEPIHSSLSRDKSNVRVISLAEEDECEDTIWATVESVDGEFDVPLEHIQPIRAAHKTVEAVEDWCYWIGQGYRFN